MQFHQYEVVGRGLPTPTEEHPRIYRMKLWATSEIHAKSKFWLGHDSNSEASRECVKKSYGQILAFNEVSSSSTII